MWGQFTLIINSLSPKRDWGPKRVKFDYYGEPYQTEPTVQTKTYICRYFYYQHLVLLTVVPRSSLSPKTVLRHALEGLL